MWTLDNFYRSPEWEAFRDVVINERTREDGFIYDEVTGEPILQKYDIILHHKTALTEDNVNDVSISLNPDNIAVVSHRTHNRIHHAGRHTQRAPLRREVFLVYGPPLAGKTTFVDSVKVPGDLIIDMDSIWQCISGMPRYKKPTQLKPIAFMMRDNLLDCVKTRCGTWTTAYIIGGYALTGERERMLSTYGAREVAIIPEKAECIKRLMTCGDDRDREAWTGYIDEWFRRYMPPGGP